MRERSAKVRALGVELRDVRLRSGLTLRDVADRLDVSISSLSRSETGLRRTGTEEVASMLTLYSVTGSERARLMHLAREAASPGEWWEAGRGLPRLLAALSAFESRANRIEQFAPSLVPGLLQTKAYIWALMRAASVPEGDAEQRVAARLERQTVLARRIPPGYQVIIDEAALRRPFGGPEVMAAQVRSLIEMAEKSHVVLQVIPFRRGAYPVTGYFNLMSFADEPPVVYLEHDRACGFLDKGADTMHYQNLTAKLRRIALDPVESVDFLRFLAADHYR